MTRTTMQTTHWEYLTSTTSSRYALELMAELVKRDAAFAFEVSDLDGLYVIRVADIDDNVQKLQDELLP